MLDIAARYLATLGHPDRLRILQHLVYEEMSVGDLAATLGISQSSLSQHLGKLREVDAVEFRKEAQSVFYRCTSEQVKSVLNALDIL